MAGGQPLPMTANNIAFLKVFFSQQIPAKMRKKPFTIVLLWLLLSDS
jgi:hypothetical protein